MLWQAIWWDSHSERDRRNKPTENSVIVTRLRGVLLAPFLQRLQRWGTLTAAAIGPTASKLILVVFDSPPVLMQVAKPSHNPKHVG